MKQIFRVTLIRILIFWISIINAEVSIEITKGTNKPQPIGIINFKWTGSDKFNEDISDIIINDLRNSGKFNPLKIPLLENLTTISDAVLKFKKIYDIDTVVIGSIHPSANGNYTVSYQLIDISGDFSIILTQNEYTITQDWLRYAAHMASDEIFEKLTGIRGIFCTRIAYVSYTKNSQYPYELIIADYDGFNKMIVYRSPKLLMSPAWSSNGREIAYVSFEHDCSSLIIQTLDSGVTRKITNFPRHNGAPSFSPDGKKLALTLSKTGSLNLYFMDLLSNKIVQITNHRSNNTEPSWFPDNETLAYTSDQGGYPQVYKINIKSGISQRLTWEGIRNQGACVSSDGNYLIMVSSNNNGQHITKLDLSTGIIQILTDTLLDETPSVAPNGTMLVYSSSEGSDSIIHLISIDGRFKTRLFMGNKKLRFPAWSPYL